jgi:hypothetical protein
LAVKAKRETLWDSRVYWRITCDACDKVLTPTIKGPVERQRLIEYAEERGWKVIRPENATGALTWYCPEDAHRKD